MSNLVCDRINQFLCLTLSRLFRGAVRAGYLAFPLSHKQLVKRHPDFLLESFCFISPLLLTDTQVSGWNGIDVIGWMDQMCQNP